MDCAGCAATVERALRQLDGVRDVRVNVLGGSVRIDYVDRHLDRDAFANAIRRVGYSVDDAASDATVSRGTVASRPAISFWAHRGRLVMATASAVLLAVGLGLQWSGRHGWVPTVLLAGATIAGGWYVVPRGLRAARDRALDMNFLMSVAAAGAWIIGAPAEAASTLFLFAVAELLEAHSMDRARHAIRALMNLSPAEATVVRGGMELRVLASEVTIGETVLVRPGEKIAVDGKVISGRSSVNQAPITGESMPADKQEGADVFAGTLNGHGALRVRSTRPASDTTLARIIHAVEEAQASRAPTQTTVDRFARLYTPFVVVVAVLIAIIPPLIGIGTWSTWVYRALATLVVACPCALVISTPVSIVSALAAAARIGVLIKGGVHLENLGRVTTVAFDKTGTLTLGRPTVTDVVALGGRTVDDVLALALGVERHSEHPLAAALLEYGRTRGIVPPDAIDFTALPGRGARARVNGETIYVGNERLAIETGIVSPDDRATLARLENDGATAVLIGSAATVFGAVAIADRMRPEAIDALGRLRSAGIRRIVMLTGDNVASADAIARALGVDEFRAQLLPDDKVRLVREFERRGEHVAFVGDGVNDAPALAAATVGIAMGAAGTDVAIETADVALMGDDLTQLAVAISLSRRALRIIRQNVALALVVKAVFLVLAVSGWATLWMAVAADMGASLAVIANGLRLLRMRG